MTRYDQELRDRIARNIAAHDLLPIPADHRHRAAVAIVVVDSEPTDSGFERGGPAFLLCRRASTLKRHSGQWALPGGRIDAGETAIEGALREVHEELGLQLQADDVLGVLDDYGTRSGFVMTPVVVWGGGLVELRPSPEEVAHVYRVDLGELSRPDSPSFTTIPESDRPVLMMPLGERNLHAPTAAVLLQFREVALEGRSGSRVHHHEQPVFAWR